MQFGSDNQTGASPQVLEMIVTANAGYTHGYGDDIWTKRAVEALRETFQCDLDAFFVSTGTAANSLALSCLVQPWEAILCHAQAHIITDESTAPEFFTNGARLIGLARGEGKLTAQHLLDYFEGAGVDIPHNPLVRALSLTQATESGLVYTPDEIASVTSVARQHHLSVHMDGARFSNAVAALGCTPADLTWKSGVDILCLGATKNGCLAAEAVIIFNSGLAEQFVHRRKRAGHLLSKGRFLSAQIIGWLKDEHWLELAHHANGQAAQLANALSAIPSVRIVWPTQANEIFAVMPKQVANYLQSSGAEFYEWYRESLPRNVVIDKNEILIRLVTSFATKDSHVCDFCSLLQSSSLKLRSPSNSPDGDATKT
ncbi:low specificity L-threonine aldolase [Oculatella sp. FACHB-28]|uniref:threonine aldolase family protein n=1 Tax=Oculatella sp. FACHB-28 TaxID=2692845 RepID=UPI0016830901|nr:low specificity L-threonine aldolase [Oculatella sp. FACHB-28]MBD2057988.1 low specificity L-threonine aldolase [Oculatella sp. FACHB-28]